LKLNENKPGFEDPYVHNGSESGLDVLPAASAPRLEDGLSYEQAGHRSAAARLECALEKGTGRSRSNARGGTPGVQGRRAGDGARWRGTGRVAGERQVRVVGEAAAPDGIGEDLDREGSAGRRQGLGVDFWIYEGLFAKRS
jgi:hypothetical protein